jgi:parvulin-like peptidyl-prolyl isomerase
MRQIILLCCLLAFVGCSKKTPPPATPASTTPSLGSSYISPVADLMPRGNPADVLVEVDGAKLTRGDVDAETEYNLQRAADRIPPDRVDVARQQIRSGIMDHFVQRTVLGNEAERQGIQATREDEESALKEIASQLPPGLTVDAMMKNSPRGEQAIRNEITGNIKIRKLLEQFSTNTIEVTDQEAADFAAMYKNNLMMPETVRARHILVAITPADDEKAKSEKKKKAEDVRQKLLEGGDFAALAKEYSDDLVSKERGGDLGPFTRERKIPAFADAAFSQATNAIGSIVETEHGYHIIQVTEHNQAGMAPREKILDILKGQKREKAFRAYLDGLKAKAAIKYSEDAAPEAPMKGVVTAPFPAPQSPARRTETDKGRPAPRGR